MMGLFCKWCSVCEERGKLRLGAGCCTLATTVDTAYGLRILRIYGFVGAAAATPRQLGWHDIRIENVLMSASAIF